METLIQQLSNAGLHEKEARVYIALLQLGRGSAYAVADRSGLKKPTAYVILGELIKKGLVMRVPREKKQLFIAKPPSEFFAFAEERLRLAKKALPELITMAESQTVKVRTLFYEGLNGVKDSLYYRKDEMKGKDIVGFYATAEDASPELMDIFNPYPENLKKNGIGMRVITPSHETTEEFIKKNKSNYTDVKTISPTLYSGKASIEAGDTFIRVILFKQLQSVVIESPELAKSVKQIFELVWSKL